MDRKRRAQKRSKLKDSIPSRHRPTKNEIESECVPVSKNEIEDKSVPVIPTPKDLSENTLSTPTTPKRLGVPLLQSTPIEGETNTNTNNSSESSDDDILCFTQDPLMVDWGEEDSPNTKKKNERRARRKASGAKKKKKMPDLPPALPTRCRRFKFENSDNGFKKLIADLKAIAELLDNNKDNKNSSNEGFSTDKAETVTKEDDSAKTVEKELLVTDKSEIGAENKVSPKLRNESYTALLDDDADDCMLQCSQEIEQKLLETTPPTSSPHVRSGEPTCSKSSSGCFVSKKSSPCAKQDRNELPNEVVTSLNTSDDCMALGFPLDRDEWSLTDTQALRRNCNLNSIPRPVPVERIQSGGASNNSFTVFLEDDADDCIVQCSQEIEEKLNQKTNSLDKPVNTIAWTRVKDGRGQSLNSNTSNSKTKATEDSKSRISTLLNSKICSFAMSSSNPIMKLQTCQGRTKSDSALSTSFTSGFGFDDSFDIVMQNFTDDDINRLSQGVSCEKNEQVHHNSVNLKRGPILKSPANRKMAFQRRDVDGRTQYKYSKSTNPVIGKNEISALNTNRNGFKMEVPSLMCGNFGALKSDKNLPSFARNTVTKSLDEKKTVGSSEYGSLATATVSTSCTLSKTSPLKYSPEEIERKRLEARKKLQKKKLNLIHVKR